jgi:hypothetical protein
MTRLIEAGSLPSCHGEAMMWDGAMAVVLHPKAKMQEEPLNISSGLIFFVNLQSEPCCRFSM